MRIRSVILFNLRKLLLVFIIATTGFGANSYAQKNKFGSNLILEGRVNYGFLINHHLEMKIFNAHFPAYEMSIGKETDGRETWQTRYGYPVIGITYWYSHLGNSPLLGSANAVFPFINYPLLRNETSQLNFRLGVGLGYISKPFDRLENYKYIAIGSHINAAINLMAEYRVHVSSRSSVALGLAAMHFSNGSIKTPNYGINAIIASMAFAYRLNKEAVKVSKKLLPGLTRFEFPESRTLNFSIGNIVAYKDMGSEYGHNFMIYNFYADAMKQITFKSNVGIELNITKNTSDDYLVKRDSLKGFPNHGLMRIAVSPLYELITGKLAYDFGLGFYANKIIIPAFAYFKIGFRYQVSEKIFAALTLHSHLGQADFVGVGIGYKFQRNYKGRR